MQWSDMHQVWLNLRKQIAELAGEVGMSFSASGVWIPPLRLLTPSGVG